MVEKLAESAYFPCAHSFTRDISRAARSAPRVPSAGVAELVDARDLGSRDESRGGSSPSARTTPEVNTQRRALPDPSFDHSPYEEVDSAMQVTETLSDGL